MIIVLSQSPSRKQAIKVLLGIIQENLSILQVENFCEIDQWLTHNRFSKPVLILDTWYLNGEITNNLLNLKTQFPDLNILLLLEENTIDETKWQEDGVKVLVGNFNPSQFLQLVREFLADTVL